MKQNESLLMSIKTKYADQIFSGTKEYEFRRKSIGEKNCHKKIYIYSSGKEKAIVGYIVVDKILKGNFKQIQELTNNSDLKDIEDYFHDCNICNALHISEYYQFVKPIELKDIKNKYKDFAIPQFYRYIRYEEGINTLLENQIT